MIQELLPKSEVFLENARGASNPNLFIKDEREKID